MKLNLPLPNAKANQEEEEQANYETKTGKEIKYPRRHARHLRGTDGACGQTGGKRRVER